MKLFSTARIDAGPAGGSPTTRSAARSSAGHRDCPHTVAYPSRSRTSYLSKVERGLEPPPGETTAIALARELQLDPDLLLAMAVKFPPNCKPLFVNAPSYSLSLFTH